MSFCYFYLFVIQVYFMTNLLYSYIDKLVFFIVCLMKINIYMIYFKISSISFIECYKNN